MGNCQAAEAATVLIQHPGGNKVDRIYWSVSANEIMNANPGHYVAQVVASAAAASAENGAAIKQLKLLRPDDTLVIGQVYRLVSFEDVLKEFAAKKCVKLGKLLRERGSYKRSSNPQSACVKTEVNHNLAGGRGSGSGSVSRGGASNRGGIARLHSGGGQWRPALQSISELGT